MPVYPASVDWRDIVLVSFGLFLMMMYGASRLFGFIYARWLSPSCEEEPPLASHVQEKGRRADQQVTHAPAPAALSPAPSGSPMQAAPPHVVAPAALSGSPMQGAPPHVVAPAALSGSPMQGAPPHVVAPAALSGSPMQGAPPHVVAPGTAQATPPAAEPPIAPPANPSMATLSAVTLPLAASSASVPRPSTAPTMPVLPVDQWLRICNDQPDSIPHLLLVAGSGCGKTTFALATLAHRAGEVLIITPKPDPHDWQDLPIVTIDDDSSFGTATQLMDCLYQEVRRRLVARKHAREVGQMLTVILDDYPVLKDEVAITPSLFKLVARLGRSLRVRLIVLTQGSGVKALGIEGEGDTRANFVRIDLDRQHRAMMEWDGQTYRLDTSSVPTLSQHPIAHERVWPTTLTVLALELSATSSGSGTSNHDATRSNGNATSSKTSGKATEPAENERDAPIEADVNRARVIRKAYQAGLSKSEISALIGGNRNRTWKAINQALGEQSAPPNGA